MFTHLFLGPLLNLSKTLQRPNLCLEVRQEFVRFVKHAFDSKSSLVTLHLRRIRAQSSIWKGITIGDTCCCCILYVPVYTLHCRHRLCASCVAICGEHTGPTTYRIARCPLCDSVNYENFVLKPTTASTRVLDLCGLVPENIMQFFVDLQRKAGLTTMPLRKHFDVVVASDYGI